jgi:hypothetical protein
VFKDVTSRIENLQLATSIKQYSSYKFDFGQLRKILSNFDSPPPSPTGLSEASTLINKTTPHNPKFKAASSYTIERKIDPSKPFLTSSPKSLIGTTNSHLKHASYHPNQLQSPGESMTSSKYDLDTKASSYLFPRTHQTSENSSDRRPSINTTRRYPEVVVEVGPKVRKARPHTNATRLPAPTFQVGGLGRDQRETISSKMPGANTTDKDPLLPTIRPTVSKSVGFMRNPVSATSRTLNEKENRAAYNFEEHAQKCVFCRDPYKVYMSHNDLCQAGHSEARRVASLMFYQTDGHVYSTTEERGRICRLELPQDYKQVKGLLEAIERSLRHRSGEPFVSMDHQKHVATEKRPTISIATSDLKIAKRPVRARSSMGADPAADMPPSSPPQSQLSDYRRSF